MKTRTLFWKGGLGSRVCVCMYVFDMRISLCSPGCLESPGDPFVSASWVLEDQDHRLRPHTSHLVYCLGKGLGGLVTWLSNTPLWSLGISVRLSNLLNKCLLPPQPLWWPVLFNLFWCFIHFYFIVNTYLFRFKFIYFETCCSVSCLSLPFARMMVTFVSYMSFPRNMVACNMHEYFWMNMHLLSEVRILSLYFIFV